MPSFFFCATKVFRALDLFPNNKLLRYNGESEYTTTTGGVISAIVLVIFIILFASMGVKTLKRQIIDSSVSTQNLIEPGDLVLTNGPGGDFMFGIFVYGINLNAPAMRFFDVKLYQEEFSTGYILQKSTSIPLVQCTKEHFSFNEGLTATFQRLPMVEGLCPSIGQVFEVRGKPSSSDYRRFRATLTRCNSTTEPTCAPDAAFNMAEATINQFTLVTVLINLNINPASQEYKTFYFEDKNHFTFNSQMGLTALGLIQEDVIETDISIMPYQEVVSENVVRIPDSFRPSYFLPKPGQNLAEVIFQKAPSTATYTRSFNKLDTYFSYVGGLVGTILGLIFIMGFYTEKAYQISLAKKIFLDEQKQDIDSKSFSIGYYFSMNLKKVLDFLRVKPNWPKTEKYIEACQEIAMQIDITYIIRRLYFLDSALSKLLEKHQLQALYLTQKPSLEQVKNQRRLHFARELFNNHQEPSPGKNEKGSNDESPGGDGANAESKLQICFEDRGLTDQVKQTDKRQIPEDVSAIELSDHQDQIEEIKASIIKVARESKRGKNRSRKIIKDLEPSTVKALGLMDEFHSEGKKSKMGEEYPIMNENQSVQEIGLRAGRGNLDSEDFQYNFDK